MSPMRTSRDGLAGWPLDSTLVNSQAFAASVRVLKNRAAQSHLSIRTEVIFITYTRIHRVGNGYHDCIRFALPPSSSSAADSCLVLDNCSVPTSGNFALGICDSTICLTAN